MPPFSITPGKEPRPLTAFFYTVSTVASLLISLLQLLMFVRAVISWFPVDDDNVILRFSYTVTEPFIYPVRLLLDRIPAFSEMPVDISFTVTFLLLFVLQLFL